MDVDLGAGQLLTLCAVDPGVLGAAGRVDALTELQRLWSWVDAQEQKLLAATVEPGEPPSSVRPGPGAVDKQFVREEIACALRISPLTVNARLHVARELTHRLSGTLVLLERGAITMRAARFLAESVGPLPDVVATRVEQRVLPRAAGQTFPNFRACVQRAVIAADPRAAEERHDAAVDERRVEFRTLEDGMGSLFAVLPAGDLEAVRTAVQAAADALPAGDDPAGDRPAGPHAADHRRAAALVSLVTGLSESSIRSWQGRRPGVQVTVALSTLLGRDEQPGELAGHGPIPAALARRIAADPSGTWRRLVIDPLGRLLDYGRSVYRPPQDLTDHVVTRDVSCRFPGCRRRAARCDIDHRIAWADGGPTNHGNLECLCARHHAVKHEAGWSVTGDPAGVLTWTSPTGHIYLDPPGGHPIDGTVEWVAGDGDEPEAEAAA